jgi:hypothetical protein
MKLEWNWFFGNSEIKASDALPPVLPLEFYYMDTRMYTTLSQELWLWLRQHVDEEEMDRINEQFRNLRQAVREEWMDKNSRAPTVTFWLGAPCWDVSIMIYGNIVGAPAVLCPDHLQWCRIRLFSIINWTGSKLAETKWFYSEAFLHWK